MATGYENYSRDDLKKALATLRKKDPNNESLQGYDRYFRSFTGASQKSALGSVELLDYWEDKFSPSGAEQRKKESSKIVRGVDGGWESKGYQKTMDKRKEKPEVDRTTSDNAQKRLKEQFGLKNVEGDLTYQEAQEMARKRREDLKESKEGGKERDGLFGFLDRTVGRASRAAQKAAFGDEFVKKQDKNYKKSENTKVNKMVNATSRKAETGGEKAADVIGGILGEIAPYAMGYGAVAKAGKVAQAGKLGQKGKQAAEAFAKSSKLKQDLVRGAGAGAIVGSGKAAARALTDEDYTKEDALKRILLETGTAGAGDAAFGALLRNLNLKGQLSKLLDNTGSKNLTDDEMKAVIEAGYAQRGNPVNVLADPKVELPNPVENPSSLKTNIVSREDLKAQAEAARQKDIEDANTMLDDLFQRRQSEEDAFVQERLAPFNDTAKRSGEAEAEWKVIQDLQNQAKRIQKEYGRFYIPEENQADWSGLVPNRFRAGKSNKKAFDIYKFADDEGFKSVDDAIEHLIALDQAAATKMNDLMPADYMNMGGGRYEALEEAARQEFGSSDTAKGIDDLFEQLMKVTRQPNPVKNEELLNSLAPQPKKTPDEILREAPVAQTQVQAQPELPDNLIRPNLQAFNTVAETNPMINTGDDKVTQSVIDSIENKVEKGIAKFQENYINRNHSLKVTEEKLLSDEIKRIKETGGDASIHEMRLKNIKKNGSDLEKSVTNMAAADAMTKDQLKRHFGGMFKAVGGDEKEVSKALEWVMAKRLLGRLRENPDYKLPQGWTPERLMNVEAGGNGKYDEFLSSVQNLKKEQLDTRLQYGMISPEDYKNLMKEEFYIPLHRDLDYRKDNVDLGYKRNNSDNRIGMDELIDEWGEGDYNSFFKNPLEVMVNTTYAVNKNALKNDAGLQMLRLTDEFPDNEFIKKISKEDYFKNGGMEVFVNGEKQYVRPQKDMLDLLKENESGLTMDMVQKATSFIAGLKTRSLEYQTGAVIRDLTEAFIKSQAGPIQWFKHAYNAVKSGNADTKAAGAYFEKAYKDHYGGIDPKEITKQFVRDNSNTRVIKMNKEGMKDLAQIVAKTVDLITLPARKIGQISDDLPRQIEVQEATRRFNEVPGLDGSTGSLKMNNIDDEIRQIDEQLTAAEGNSDAFSSELSGIDTLAARKTELEQQKLSLQRDLKREQTYQGRDIMNYSRAGRGKASQFIRKYFMFANTTTQSKDKLVRSFMQRPGQTLAKTGIAVAPMVAIQQVAHNMMTDDDKALFDSLPNYLTNYNYVFVNDGEVTVLPKPHEMALLTNPIEDMMTGQSLDDSMRLLARELLPYQTGTALQGLVPNEDGSTTFRANTQLPGTVATPGVDILANQKMGFNQKRISWGAMKQDPADQVSSDFTYDFIKELAGDNPRADFAQYAAQQYGGDPAKYLMAAAEYARDTGNTDKLDNLLKNLNPLQDRFFSDRNRFFKNVPTEDKNK